MLTLVAIAAACVLVVAAARRWPGPKVRVLARILAIALVAAEGSWWIYAAARHLPLSIALPLHVCDVAPLVAAAALWWRHPLAAEIAYFWGLAGSLMALLTPDLPDVPGSFLWTQYVIEHGVTVLAALLLPLGMGLAPRRGALGRAVAATAAVALVAGVADLLTGGNYMFLRHPPASPTLLNLLGPWPWYLASVALIAFGLLALLDLPFRLRRRVSIPSPPVRHLSKEIGP
ncbi:MAG: TIGR02206 family membrane protein [Chloroflexota bacterium]